MEKIECQKTNCVFNSCWMEGMSTHCLKSNIELNPRGKCISFVKARAGLIVSDHGELFDFGKED